jgi:YidC/Oxa1 family membrane protein insertase
MVPFGVLGWVCAASFDATRCTPVGWTRFPEDLLDRNAFLAFALSFLVLSVWMTWEAKHRPVPPPSEVVAQTNEPAIRGASSVPPATATNQAASMVPPTATSQAEQPVGPEELVEIVTPLYHAVLTSHGAGVRRFELREYLAPRSEGGGPVALIARPDGELPAFATPLAELGLGDLGKADFRILSGDPRKVAFEKTLSGVTVTKTFFFDENTYRFRVRLDIKNAGTRDVSPEFGVLLPEQVQPGSDFRELTIAALVQGSIQRQLMASFGKSGGIGALFGSSPQPQRDFVGDIEWSGAYSHYFLTALIPDVARDARVRWLAVRPGEETLVTMSQPAVSVPAGTSVAHEYSIYAGPKEPERLAAVGAQLDRSIDLGWSWMAPLTRGFAWLLKAIYSIVPNYGVAIILLTVMVRLCTAPLAAKQMKSMKRMGEIQPRLKALQEKYKDDKQQQSQETMKLYKEAGVNPLGGCLPMVLQIPVFIGLYYALQSSIDLRQAPFMLWINDLSRPETLFTVPGVGWPVRVLPVLMTLSMVIQQRMTPSTTMDPVQARPMMSVMPVMFFFMFYGFPAGLVLYWFVSNLLAIAQQLYLNRQLTPRPA